MRAISCPVKTHPEWKALVEEVGEARAYYLWDTMQDDNEFSGKLSSTISSPIFEINLDPFADNTRIMESMARVFSNYGLPINLYNKPLKDNEVLNSKNELTRISKEGGYLGEIANMILRKRLSETSRINLISLPENYLGLTKSQPDQHTWHGSKVHKTDVALDPSNISLAQRRGLLEENAFDQTLVHEEVHRYTQSLFATYREMLAQGIPLDSNPEALSPSDINFIEEVTELYHQYMTVRKKNPKFKNAESTIDEFLAWGLTNPEFMEYLSTIKVENTSILEKLIEFLRRLFGGSINMQQALKQSFDNYMKFDAYVGTMLRSDELLKPATNSSAFNAFQELMVSVLGNESLPPISYMPYYLNWMKDHPFVMKAMEGFESEYDFIDHLLENPNNKWQKQFFKLLSQELFSQIDLNNFFLDLNKAYYNPSLEATDISIKEGVEELFNENPELANAVYEALGFVGDINKLKYQDFLTKIGEATELKEQVEKLKSYVEQFKTAYFVINIEEDIQSDIFFFKEEAEKALEEYNNRGDLKFEIDTAIGLTDKEIQVYKDVIEFLAQNPDQNPLNEEEYTGAKKLEEYLKYKHGLTSKQIKNILIGNKEKERLTDFINIQLELSQLQKIEGESGLPNNLTELELAKVTPQQKQQAQQLYAQYLEQNPNGTVEGFKNWVDNNQSNVQYQKQIDLQAEQDSVLEEFANSLSERFNISFDLVSEEDARAMFSEYTNEPAFFDPKTKKAYLVKGKANKTSAIHEIFTHPFLLQIEKTNSTLYKNLLKEAKNNKSIVDYVDNLYGTNQNNDHEYIARAIDLAVQGELDQQKDKTLLERIQEFFNRLSDYLKKLFNIPKVFNSAISPNITLQQLAQFAMYGKGKMNLNPAQENIEYSLKATDVIVKNLKKINRWEKNKSISEDVLWSKIQGLGVPKEQLELVKNSEGNTVEEKLLDFTNQYSYTVEINTAKEPTINKNVDYERDGAFDEDGNFQSESTTFSLGGFLYEKSVRHYPFGYGKIKSEDGYIGNSKWESISPREYEEALDELKSKEGNEKPTQHYSYLTVPGGTNYTENAIQTPDIINLSIAHIYDFAKGIANMLGWFRSDEQVKEGSVRVKDQKAIEEEIRYYETLVENREASPEDLRTLNQLKEGSYKKEDVTKTRRILELQSDLFQKGRDEKEALSWNRYILDSKGDVIGKNPNFQSEQDFLNLLRKNNNWVTFFVKSIIQDSAKKGYEKVLFPLGETIAKIEQYEEAAKIYAQLLAKKQRGEKLTVQEENAAKEYEELNQKSVVDFYEVTLTNILKKQGYNPVLITDEYGNTWNEITIDENRDNQNIVFQKTPQSKVPQKKQPPSKASVKGADQIYDSTAKTMSLEDWSKLLDLIVKKGISGGRFMEAINILKNQEDGFEEAFHLVLRSISEDPHYVMYMETALKRYGMASEKNLDEFVKENPHVARLSRTQLRTIYYDAKMARDYLAYKKGNKKLPKGILGRIFSLMDDVVDTSIKNKDQVLATLAETSKEITQEEQRYPVHEKYKKATYSRILKTDRRGAPITFEQSEMLIIQIANHVVEELEAISENFTAQITEDQYHAAVINAISEVRDRYAIEDILDEDGNILVEGWYTKLVRKYGKSPSKEGVAKILRVFETLYKILSVLPQDITVSPSGVLNTENPQDRRNLSVILNEVSKHVNFYLKSSQTIEQEMESEEDERGEAWNLAQYEEGGYMRIPERLKMLISRATYFEDEFGLGAALEEGLSLDEIEQMERYRKPVDAVRVYNAIIKVLSNTPKEMMIHKMKQYTEFSDNVETKKFFDFFLNQVTQELNKKLPNPITPIELRDASPETISFYMTLSPSLNMLLIAGQGSILPAFDILLDYNSGIYKVAESYQKDIEVAQIHRWRANLDAKNMSLEDFNDSITEVLSVMNSIFSEGESIRITIPSTEELNGYISQIQEIFNEIGINFSKPFIKYSIIKENLGIIHKKFAQITSNIYDEDVTTSQVADILELTKWVENYENVPHISREDLRTVRGRSKALGIPTLMIFGSEKDTKENRENETSSRFVNWAKGNSFFDESVTPSSYMNMESEYVQTYSPSFYYSEMIDEFRRGGNNTLREYIMSYIYPLREDYKHVTDIPAEKLTEALNKLEEYSVNNNPMPTRMHTLLTFNLLFNDPFFTFGGETISPEVIETHFSKMELAMLGGGRQQAMKETVEGEIELLRRRTMGKNFAKQTTADKILMEMTLFQRRTEVTTRAKRKPGEKERADGYQYVRMGINSEKRRQFIVKMPYFNSIDLDKGTLTSEGRAALRSLLKQEYEIIRNTYNQRDAFEKIPGINVEYDDLMFKFKRMRTTNNEQMLLELEDRAKNENIPFEELVELVDDIIDTYVEDKVADFINEVNSTTNILYMAKKNDSMVYFSDSLPNYYKTEGKRTGTVNMHAIADYVITSTLVKTSLMNMLNLGGHFASYKDARAEVKRMSMGSAQGNNMGSGNSKVSIFESVELPIEAEEAQRHGFGQNGETVDSTDGIMYASIEWYMDIFLTSESAPDFVKKILRKSRRGYSLTDAEYNMLYRERAVPQSLKLQANTAYIGLKSSHATIIRSSVSSIKDDMRWEMNDFFDAWEELEDTYDPSAVYSGRFKKYAGYTLDRFKRESIQFFEPIPGREALHNALNDMYTGKYDIYAASSASKKPTGNEYTVPNKFIRKQQDTYGFKNEITDPTQKRHLVHSEILDNAVVMANNIEMFGKEAVDYYKQLLAERININLTNKRTQMLLMLGVPNYKRMLTDFAKTMERTNQSPYLLEMFSYNEETADPMYDLNLPSVVAKYEAMYLSLYTNGPLIQKAKGTKFTLLPDYGFQKLLLDGNPITTEQYKLLSEAEKSLVTTERLKHRVLEEDGNYYSEAMVSQAFTKLFGLKIGDNIPSELLKFMGVRIPTQDKHSMVNVKVVDILPGEYGNNIILPMELVGLTGWDFDIDAFYARVLTTYKLGEVPTPYGEYLNAPDATSAKIRAYYEYLHDLGQNNARMRDYLAEKGFSNTSAKSIMEGVAYFEEWKEIFGESDVLPFDGKQAEKNWKAFQEGKYSEVKPLTKGEVDNHLLKLEIGLLHNSHNKEIAATPATRNLFAQRRELYIEMGIRNEENVHEPLSPGSQVKLESEISGGQEGVGIAAAFNVVFQYFAKSNPHITKGSNGEYLIKGEDGTMIRVNDIISQMITIMVDANTHGDPGFFNITRESLAVFGQLLLQGKSAEFAIDFINQPAVVQYFKKLENTRATLAKRDVDKKKIMSIVIQEMGLKGTAKAQLTETDLLNNLINPEDSVQLKALNMYEAMMKDSQLVRSWATFLSTASRGLGSNLSEAFKKKNILPDDPHTLEILEDNPHLSRQAYIVNEDAWQMAEHFLLGANPFYNEILDALRPTLSEVSMNVEDGEIKLRNALTSFMYAKAIRNANKVQNNSDILFTDELYRLIGEVKNMDEFLDNKLLNYLEMSPVVFEYGSMAGLTFHNIRINTRRKEESSTMGKMMDDYSALFYSDNPKARDLAEKLRDFLLMRDAFLYKNGSYINTIDPRILRESGTFDITRNILSILNDPKAIMDTFGATPTQLMYEFHRIFVRASENKKLLRRTQFQSLFKIKTKSGRPTFQAVGNTIIMKYVLNSEGSEKLNGLFGAYDKFENGSRVPLAFSVSKSMETPGSGLYVLTSVTKEEDGKDVVYNFNHPAELAGYYMKYPGGVIYAKSATYQEKDTLGSKSITPYYFTESELMGFKKKYSDKGRQTPTTTERAKENSGVVKKLGGILPNKGFHMEGHYSTGAQLSNAYINFGNPEDNENLATIQAQGVPTNYDVEISEDTVALVDMNGVTDITATLELTGRIIEAGGSVILARRDRQKKDLELYIMLSQKTKGFGIIEDFPGGRTIYFGKDPKPKSPDTSKKKQTVSNLNPPSSTESTGASTKVKGISGFSEGDMYVAEAAHKLLGGESLTLNDDSGTPGSLVDFMSDQDNMSSVFFHVLTKQNTKVTQDAIFGLLLSKEFQDIIKNDKSKVPLKDKIIKQLNCL